VSRTLAAGMVTHLATRSHTRATMLLLELRDGTSIGITNHPVDLDYDYGDGSVTYRADTGILPSDVAMACGLESSNYEVAGPLGDLVTKDAVLGGRFDRARAYLFQVNWKNLAQGAIKFPAGNVSEARVEGGKFVFEIRTDTDRYNQVVGRVLANNCDADFGDARCGATPVEVVGTITAVTSERDFAVSYTGSHADNFFNKGTVIGLTGANAGLVKEIFDWSVAGAIELFEGLPSVPEIGDTFTVREGCGKSRADCMAHDNILNFRGYPEVPGRPALRPAIG
jgi:uncharacterized phage protein (TIGR02218 family)